MFSFYNLNLLYFGIILIVFWELAVRAKKIKLIPSTAIFANFPVSFRKSTYKKSSLLRYIPIIFFLVALARPQGAIIQDYDKSQGRNFILALDVSGSMAALDLSLNGKQQTRLSVLKYIVSDFIKKRSFDRFGIVIFGGEVTTLAPVSEDSENLLKMIDSTELGMLGDGTALGDGLVMAVKRLKDLPGKANAIILVTDGLKNAGSFDPLEAAQVAEKLGIKVYTIGIGGKEPAPFLVPLPFGGSTIQYQKVPVDEVGLKKIALLTKGIYASAKSQVELQKIFDEIDKIESVEHDSSNYIQREELFSYFLFLGFCSLIYFGLTKF